MYTPFDEEGGGVLRKYVLYTQLNVDNYGQPLSMIVFHYIWV